MPEVCCGILSCKLLCFLSSFRKHLILPVPHLPRVLSFRYPVLRGLCKESFFDHFLIQCAGVETLGRFLELAVHQCRPK